MRKQTKVVAVASAAALLAIGASMTSFAATGWVEEDGTWYWYDRDGVRVEDTWKKSGDNWYWLSSEEGGAMAMDYLVEDGDDTYYVDANGVMVRNTWVKVVNEEQDDDDDPAEYNYYYMQSNGKAYKAGENNTRFRTIDGKRYAFDSDGKMLYGWVDVNSDRLSGDQDWITRDDVYYCGNWDDGAMKTGWQKITVTMEDDEDEDHWFWFKSNGKRYQLTDSDSASGKDISTKTINGKKYGFDDRGVMVYEWTMEDEAIGTDSNGNPVTSSNWRYFNNPEDGARVTKGWFKVVAPDEDNDNTFKDNAEYGSYLFGTDDADDEEERWYYADGDGKLAVGEIKKIKGKYYGFRPDYDANNGDNKGAAMLSGLVLLQVDANGKILSVIDDGVDADELDDLLVGDYTADGFDSATPWSDVSLYYFGDPDSADSDGAMRTGSVTINIDGSSYNFKFNKSGGKENRGKGVNEVDDKKYIYKYGCRIKASTDDKYKVVRVDSEDSDGIWPIKDSALGTLRTAAASNIATKINPTKDAESIKVVDHSSFANCYLVNSSGTIVKDKAAGKDGADWYFYVNNGEYGNGIFMYISDKKLTNLHIKDWKSQAKTSMSMPGGWTE